MARNGFDTFQVGDGIDGYGLVEKYLHAVEQDRLFH
jgi:hypothetical protein